MLEDLERIERNKVVNIAKRRGLDPKTDAEIAKLEAATNKFNFMSSQSESMGFMNDPKAKKAFEDAERQKMV